MNKDSILHINSPIVGQRNKAVLYDICAVLPAAYTNLKADDVTVFFSKKAECYCSYNFKLKKYKVMFLFNIFLLFLYPFGNFCKFFICRLN